MYKFNRNKFQHSNLRKIVLIIAIKKEGINPQNQKLIKVNNKTKSFTLRIFNFKNKIMKVNNVKTLLK